MDIKKIQERALEVRAKYDTFNKEKNGQVWTTLQLAQGFAGDAGQFQKLAMAKAGLRKIDDVDSKIRHELSDCLWSVLVLADKYGFDIEESFMRTMDELDQRIDSSY